MELLGRIPVQAMTLHTECYFLRFTNRIPTSTMATVVVPRAQGPKLKPLFAVGCYLNKIGQLQTATVYVRKIWTVKQERPRDPFFISFSSFN